MREYIETGEPVASQMLARESGLGVSSATIRNVLAQLEERGYLHQPHTSAGRVPTDRGYRVFVDLLLETRKPARPSANVEQQLRQQAERSPLDRRPAGERLASGVARRQARRVCAWPAARSAPCCSGSSSWRSAASRVLVVVVSRGNQVTQKVVDAGEDVRS